MKFWGIAANSMILAASVQAASPASDARIPAQFHGLWYVDDEEGRSQCVLYKDGTTLGPDDNFRVGLVGATVIAPALFHSVAEYGESNFYRPVSITHSGEASVTFTSSVTFDGSDEIASYPILTLTKAREGKLNVAISSIGDGGTKPPKSETLFRCADKPDNPQYSDNPPD